jgi:hypothetical protein
MNIISKLIPHSDEKQIHVGEAYSIWSQAVARYDTLELAQYLGKFAHDKDLKVLINFGISNVIQPQIKKIEELAEKFNVPLTTRPPKSINISDVTDPARDEEIFRIIFDGAQSALLIHIKEINIAINDTLRSAYIDFLKNDLENYEGMVRYGKVKGWIKSPPIYNQ